MSTFRPTSTFHRTESTCVCHQVFAAYSILCRRNSVPSRLRAIATDASASPCPRRWSSVRPWRSGRRLRRLHGANRIGGNGRNSGPRHRVSSMRSCFKDGAEVQKDAPLYEIDDREFQADLEAAKAELATALAHQEKATCRFQARRGTEDKGRHHGGPVRPDRSPTKKEADAQVQSAEAKQDRAQLNVDFSKIAAPDRRKDQPQQIYGREPGRRQQDGSDIDRLGRSDVRLFRRRRADVSYSDAAGARGQARERGRARRSRS